MRIFVCLAVTAMIAAPRAQSLDGAMFDVVSIRRNNGAGGMQARTVPGSFSVSGVPLHFVIRQAFQVQDFQITGGPDWINSDLWDIDARFDVAAGPTGPPAMAARLGNMLAGRFKFSARTEQREMPILALVRARTDGQLGKQIKPSQVDCTAAAAGRGGPVRSISHGRPRPTTCLRRRRPGSCRRSTRTPPRLRPPCRSSWD